MIIDHQAADDMCGIHWTHHDRRHIETHLDEKGAIVSKEWWWEPDKERCMEKTGTWCFRTKPRG